MRDQEKEESVTRLLDEINLSKKEGAVRREAFKASEEGTKCIELTNRIVWEIPDEIQEIDKFTPLQPHHGPEKMKLVRELEDEKRRLEAQCDRLVERYDQKLVTPVNITTVTQSNALPVDPSLVDVEGFDKKTKERNAIESEELKVYIGIKQIEAAMAAHGFPVTYRQIRNYKSKGLEIIYIDKGRKQIPTITESAIIKYKYQVELKKKEKK